VINHDKGSFSVLKRRSL